MRAVLLLIIVLVLVGLGRVAYVMVPASGALVTLEPRLVENCTRVDVAPGTEDVTIDPDTRMAFVSAADRRDPQMPPGGIYTFNLDSAAAPQLVSVDAPDDFRPHGISLFKGVDGTKRLFVINHPKAGGHVVEIFDVGADTMLSHVKTVSFDEMHSPNDLVAVGPESFYASNDRGYREGFMSTVEAYLALPFASAVYWDGEAGSTVVTGLTYANGINVSADGGTVYIAEFLGRNVGIYTRDAATGALTHVKSIPVDTGADNIEVAEDGALWIGAHAKVLEFLAHAQDPAEISPSQVIRVDPATGEVETVFAALDGTISGSSVGAVNGGTLVVGAVFDGHVMVCPLEQ